MYDAIEDPYTYKKSTVLVNKLDLQNQAGLDAFEAEISSARAEEPLPDGSLDFEHYKAIHHHLFQDVYHWAGQVRTVRIAKGGNPFCFPENIEGVGEQTVRRFAIDRPSSKFRCANICRQGGAFPGRAERHPCFPGKETARRSSTFFALLADHAGHPLKIEELNPGEMLAAMVASFDGDDGRLADVIYGLIE